jgi:hypothetical protein
MPIDARRRSPVPAGGTAATPRVGTLALAAVMLAFGLLGGVWGCNGSSSQVTTPTPTTRCTVTLATTSRLMAYTGGSGTITVATNRDCTWQAQSSADWLFFTSPVSGQGDATLSFSVSSNSVVSQRQAVVTVGDARIEIRQAAAFCTYGLNSAGRTFPAAGGVDRIVVDARDGCAWAGQASESWIAFDTTATQIGQGSIGITVAANTGGSRSATVYIAGLPWVVTQQAAGTSLAAPMAVLPEAR